MPSLRIALLLLAGAFLDMPAACASEDADAAYSALLAAHKAGEHQEALTRGTAFLEAHPEYRHLPAVRYITGHAALVSGAYEQAETEFRRLLVDHPDYKMADEAGNELATALERMRRLKACIEVCRSNLRTWPADGSVGRWRYLIGQCLFRLWRFEEAEKALRAIVQEHPESNLVARAESYLDRIEPDMEVDEHGVVRGYAGKYVGDVRFRRVRARVPELRRSAWARIRRRLGVDLSETAGILVLFQDADDRARTGLRGSAYSICRDAKPTTVITFYTEYVVLSPNAFEKRLVHVPSTEPGSMSPQL